MAHSNAAPGLLTFGWTSEGAEIRALHPLDEYRRHRFIKSIVGDHRNYYRAANVRVGGIIVVIPRNAYKSRGRT